MSQSTQLSTIQFHNQTLITFEQDNVQYVAMRPICENIGLAWGSQYERINRDDVLSSTMVIITTVAEDGKKREMICLPIEYLNGWLFGIDVKRVKPEIRDLLITYKKECYKALADYWMKGKAERQQLALPEPEPTYSRTLTERQWLEFASLWFACYNNLELLGRIYPPLEALGSRLGVEAYTHCTEYRTTLEVMKRILEPMLAEFDVDPRKEPHYYRALRTLREFKLKGLGAVVKI